MTAKHLFLKGLRLRSVLLYYNPKPYTLNSKPKALHIITGEVRGLQYYTTVDDVNPALGIMVYSIPYFG